MPKSKDRDQAHGQDGCNEGREEGGNSEQTSSGDASRCRLLSTVPESCREPEALDGVTPPEPDSPSGRLLSVFLHQGQFIFQNAVTGQLRFVGFKTIGVGGVANLLLDDQQLGQDVIRVCQNQISRKMPPERPSDPPPGCYLIMSHTELKDLIINAFAVVLIIYGIPLEVVEVARHLCKRNGEPRDIPKNRYTTDFRIFCGGILLVMQLIVGERDLVYLSGKGIPNPNPVSLLPKLRRLLRGQKLSEDLEQRLIIDPSGHPNTNSGTDDSRCQNPETLSSESRSAEPVADVGTEDMVPIQEQTLPT